MEGLTLKQLIERELQINEFPPEWWNINKDAEIERLYKTLYGCDNFRQCLRSINRDKAEDCHEFIVEVIKRYRRIKPLFLKQHKQHKPYCKHRDNWQKAHETIQDRLKVNEAIRELESGKCNITLQANKAGKLSGWCVSMDGEQQPIRFSDADNIGPDTTEFFGTIDKSLPTYTPDSRRYKQVRETLLSFLYARKGAYRFKDKYITEAAIRQLNEKYRVQYARKNDARVKACSEFYDYLLQSKIAVWKTYNGVAESREGEVKDFISSILGEVLTATYRRLIIKNIS